MPINVSTYNIFLTSHIPARNVPEKYIYTANIMSPANPIEPPNRYIIARVVFLLFIFNPPIIGYTP